MPEPEPLDPRIEAEIKANGHQLLLLREIRKRIRVTRKRGRRIGRIGETPPARGKKAGKVLPTP